MAFTSPINDEITFSDPHADGTIKFSCPQGDLDLRFDWRAMVELQSQWGEEFLTRASAGMDGVIVEDLAIIVAAASRKSAPEISRMSPPIIPLVNACKLAWSYAWNGGEPPEERDAEPEKKSAQLNLFGWRLKLPFVQD